MEDDDAFSVSDTEAGKSDDDVDHDHVVTAACDSDDGDDHGGTAGCPSYVHKVKPLMNHTHGVRRETASSRITQNQPRSSASARQQI